MKSFRIVSILPGVVITFGCQTVVTVRLWSLKRCPSFLLHAEVCLCSLLLAVGKLLRGWPWPCRIKSQGMAFFAGEEEGGRVCSTPGTRCCFHHPQSRRWVPWGHLAVILAVAWAGQARHCSSLCNLLLWPEPSVSSRGHGMAFPGVLPLTFVSSCRDAALRAGLKAHVPLSNEVSQP